MKKLYKILAATFALTLIAASPAATITSHAYGFNQWAHDDTDYGYRPDDYGQNWSNDSGSTESSQPAPKVEDNGSGSNDSGYSGSGFNPNAHDDTDYGTRPSGYGENASQTGSDDVTVKAEGGQAFRSVMNKDHTAYEVYHKGASVASFAVTDAKGNVVAFSTVALEKGTDGLWYLNITLPAGVDAKSLTVALTKGDLAYLAKELGITGIQLNGKVVMLTESGAVDTGKESDSKVAEEKKSDSKVAEEKKTDNKVTEEKKADTTAKDAAVAEDEPAGYRVCWCGYKVAIKAKGGLSASEKAEWAAHSVGHLLKSESTSYTDIVNKK